MGQVCGMAGQRLEGTHGHDDNLLELVSLVAGCNRQGCTYRAQISMFFEICESVST